MTRDDVLSMLDNESQVIFFDPPYLDKAILGITSDSPGWSMEPRVCYSSKKIVELLTREEDMAYDEALEYFDFNIQGLGMSDPPPPLLVWDWS